MPYKSLRFDIHVEDGFAEGSRCDVIRSGRAGAVQMIGQGESQRWIATVVLSGADLVALTCMFDVVWLLMAFVE